MNNLFTFEAEPFSFRSETFPDLEDKSQEYLREDSMAGYPGIAEELGRTGQEGKYLDPNAYEAGSPKPECPDYEAGEIEKSHCQEGACQQGILAADVTWHPRGLLIADFGVGWHGMKAATRKEKLLQQWMDETKADPHSILLRIYGYSDCVGSEKDNVQLRHNRALRVYGLLDKDLQSRVAFKGGARAGEYVSDNKTKEGRAKNRGVIIEVSRFQEDTIFNFGKAPKPPRPRCPFPPCNPPPPPPPGEKRNWKLVGKFSWKAEKQRKAKRGYFELYVEPEVEVTGSVNATNNEFATFAAKWEKGKGPGGQFETKFSEWFMPDIKLERGPKGWKLAFKKEFKLLGETLVLTPHLQVSPEVVKMQADLLPFQIPLSLLGQEVRLDVKPRVNIIIKVDLWQVFLDRLKNKLKDWFKDLLQDLLARLGRGALGALGGKVLAGLLGGVLAHLFLSNSPTAPITAPADDVNGKDRALRLIGNTSSAIQMLQTWANTHRHAFAKAYADTIHEFSRENWKERLAELRSRTLNGYKALPAPDAPEREWVVWASTRKALEVVSIDLPTDNFARRFRWYELMLMFALVAWLLRKMTKAELHTAKAMALQQASVAGMAAAVQYVNRQIANETFEFIDENGQAQRADGVNRWDTIGKLVRLSKLSDSEISKRLEQLGVKQLPRLPKTA